MILFAFAEGGIQLVPDGTIFIHIALILLMIWILNRTFFRPINRILEERERKSGRGAGAANDILSQVDEKTAGYETALREARTEGYHLLESQRAEAMTARQTQVTAVKEEVDSLITTEKDSLQQQAEAARGALSDDAQKMAKTISATILKNT